MNGNHLKTLIMCLQTSYLASHHLISHIHISRPRSTISISQMLIVFTCLTNSQMISVSDEEEENN